MSSLPPSQICITRKIHQSDFYLFILQNTGNLKYCSIFHRKLRAPLNHFGFGTRIFEALTAYCVVLCKANFNKKISLSRVSISSLCFISKIYQIFHERNYRSSTSLAYFLNCALDFMCTLVCAWICAANLGHRSTNKIIQHRNPILQILICNRAYKRNQVIATTVL